jgi:hypothetical protein
MDFEIAELPLDDENAALHVSLLQGDVGEGLDIKSRSHFNDLRRHIPARQRTFDPGAKIAHGLRLQLVQEDE